MKSYIITAFATAATLAASHAEGDKGASEKEKCYGIAKAGKNDCASANKSHECAGHATKDNDPNEWAYAEKGKCKEMGGSPTAPTA